MITVALVPTDIATKTEPDGAKVSEDDLAALTNADSLMEVDAFKTLMRYKASVKASSQQRVCQICQGRRTTRDCCGFTCRQLPRLCSDVQPCLPVARRCW